MNEIEIKVRVIISDFLCDPEKITQIIEINSDKIWRKGECVHSKAKNIHKQNGWMIMSACDYKNTSVDEQVGCLLHMLAPHMPNFKNLPSNSKIEQSCIVYTHGERPVLNFSSAHVKTLGEIGASIDIDLYDLGESNLA